MYIGIVSVIFDELRHGKGEEAMRYFDATAIRRIQRDDASGYTVFMVEGDGEYATETYDCGGLVELAMQARLRPAEFMPSLYVGKKAPADDAPNSVHWSAPGREK